MRSGRRLRVAPELAHHPHDGIEVVGHPLLERNDPVVGDVDVLGTYLGAALRDVAEPDPALVADELGPVARVERVHLEPGDLDEEARAGEALLEIVVADDVADVLAEETLDALVELLPALDVLLHHPVLAVRIRRLEPERRHLLGLLVVVGDVGDQVADDRERPDRRHRDRLLLPATCPPGPTPPAPLVPDLPAPRGGPPRPRVH